MYCLASATYLICVRAGGHYSLFITNKHYIHQANLRFSSIKSRCVIAWKVIMTVEAAGLLEKEGADEKQQKTSLPGFTDTCDCSSVQYLRSLNSRNLAILYKRNGVPTRTYKIPLYTNKCHCILTKLSLYTNKCHCILTTLSSYTNKVSSYTNKVSLYTNKVSLYISLYTNKPYIPVHVF